MSVEEARLHQRQAYANLNGLALSQYAGVVDDLAKARLAATESEERLILEVQAAMPCARAETDHWSIDESHPDCAAMVADGSLNAEGMCSRCTARAKLTQPGISGSTFTANGSAMNVADIGTWESEE